MPPAKAPAGEGEKSAAPRPLVYSVPWQLAVPFEALIELGEENFELSLGLLSGYPVRLQADAFPPALPTLQALRVRARFRVHLVDVNEQSAFQEQCRRVLTR